MKRTFKFFTSVIAAAFLAAASFALDSATSEKAFKLMESADDTLAYHGDYSATISLLIQKPGKPDNSLKYKVFQRTDKDLPFTADIPKSHLVGRRNCDRNAQQDRDMLHQDPELTGRSERTPDDRSIDLERIQTGQDRG